MAHTCGHNCCIIPTHSLLPRLHWEQAHKKSQYVLSQVSTANILCQDTTACSSISPTSITKHCRVGHSLHLTHTSCKVSFHDMTDQAPYAPPQNDFLNQQHNYSNHISKKSRITYPQQRSAISPRKGSTDETYSLFSFRHRVQCKSM
jgi:hypothetical protein